jgi:glycerol-3-phosphate dehydrogenase
VPVAPDASVPATRGTFDRDEALGRLRSEHFDILVIGGGITGAGVALDAASRGLHTALVERHDIASGTSSKSSKLVHGGIRYIAQRDLRLVHESLRERQRLLENAPHLVTPLPFLLPLFGRDGLVQKSVASAYSTTLSLYDMTGGWQIGERHRRVDRTEALAHLPTLRTERFATGFLYYDAWADDARLTLAIARTAALDHGAVIANYAEVEGLLHDSSGKVAGARVRNAAPVRATVGASIRAAHDGAFEVRAAVVVNATGVWADDVRALDEGTHPRSLRPAKGIHVTVPRSKLPTDVAAVIPVPSDRRSIFVVPWPDGDDVYIGTTDTAWEGQLDDPACLPEDLEYLIGATNAVVREPVSNRDVTGLWAGLRPLLAPGVAHKAISDRTADLSRRHSVRSSPRNLVTVTGGKLTTYRRMAEDTVDEVMHVLGSAVPRGVKSCGTARLAIRGSRGLEQLLGRDVAREHELHGLDEDVFRALVQRHGGETTAVLELASGRPELLEPLVAGLPYLRAEAVWAARQEMAVTLDDVLSRRTRCTIRRAIATTEAASEVGKLLEDEWGRSTAEVASEAGTLVHEIRAFLDRAGVAGNASDASHAANLPERQ